MPRMRDLKAVDENYAQTAPHHATITEDISCPAANLFRCLEDGPAWKEWLGIDVEWTSPKPFGVGTTRNVSARGQQIEEYFTAWDPGHRMAFRFDRTTLPLAAFAEDYVIAERGADACQLSWHFGYEWDAPLAAVTQPLFHSIFQLQGRGSLKKLAALMANEGHRWAE